MAFKKIFAQLNCSDLSASREWYEKFFGRPPDACPMAGLAEWHHEGCAGLQIFQSAGDAGHGTLTLIVDGLKDERARLENVGLNPGDLEPATSISLVRLRDPDGNLIVLAQPGDL
jgi:catechol 2,3-dioxygenase-like lactoylglutathione lyase family enzyme